LNDDVLNLSVNGIKNMLGLQSTHNTVYNDKTIVYHLLNAAVSRTIVSNVGNLRDNAPSEGTIRYKLKNIDFDGIAEFKMN
jgi:putative transposase